jgi:hypothetical protein
VRSKCVNKWRRHQNFGCIFHSPVISLLGKLFRYFRISYLGVSHSWSIKCDIGYLFFLCLFSFRMSENYFQILLYNLFFLLAFVQGKTRVSFSTVYKNRFSKNKIKLFLFLFFIVTVRLEKSSNNWDEVFFFSALKSALFLWIPCLFLIELNSQLGVIWTHMLIVIIFR